MKIDWILWLLVLISILLAPVSGVPDAVSGGCANAIWQSAFDPAPWLGRFYRLGGSVRAGWWKIRKRVNEWERWVAMAIRLWSCHNLAEVIQTLTRRQLVRYFGALPVLVALLNRLQVRQIINRHCPTQGRTIMEPWSWCRY